MNPIVKNILAVIAGVVIGSIVNMGIISISPSIIPPPEGIDVNDIESIKANFHLYETKHFIFPWIAHALGTFVGALVAFSIATTHKLRFALGIGVWFLAGGTAMIFMLPTPTWFIIADLGFAYLPMAWLVGKILKA